MVYRGSPGQGGFQLAWSMRTDGYDGSITLIVTSKPLLISVRRTRDYCSGNRNWRMATLRTVKIIRIPESTSRASALPRVIALRAR